MDCVYRPRWLRWVVVLVAGVWVVVVVAGVVGVTVAAYTVKGIKVRRYVILYPRFRKYSYSLLHISFLTLALVYNNVRRAQCTLYNVHRTM